MAVVPTWRRDLAIEADVAEEVARVRGYETTPAHLPDTLMPAYRPSPLSVRDTIRETLAGAGLTEVVTHALVSSAERRPAALAGGLQRAPTATRTGLGGRRRDRRHEPALGPAFGAAAASRRQPARRAVAQRASGTRRRRRLRDRQGLRPRGRSAPGVDPPRPPACRAPRPPHRGTERPARYDLDDAKGLVELLCHRLGLPAPSYVADSRGFPFHPGRALAARSEGEGEALSAASPRCTPTS